MKKLLIIMLTLTMILSTFASFASASDVAADDNRAVIKVFHRWPLESPDGIIMVNLFNAFNESQDEYVVVQDTVPASMYEAQLTVRLASNDAPDVYCLWPGGRAESQVRNGAILDITDLWQEEGWLDEFTPAVVEGAKHMDGAYYTLPMDNMTNAFWYNTHIFEAAGVEKAPETWEELMVAAQKIQDAGFTPFAFGANPTRWMAAFWFDYVLLNTAGGEFRENLMWGKESWESEEVYKVFEILSEPIKKGFFNKDYASVDQDQAVAYMASGKTAMILNGPWSINQYIAEDVGWVPEEDFDMFAFPSLDPQVPQASQGCMQAWCINPNSANIEGSKALFSWMATKESVESLSQMKNTIGARRDLDYGIYSDATKNMLKKLGESTSENALHQNFELATLPMMQDAGMDGIIEFFTFPDTYKQICTRLEQVSREVFE